jgi:hypothetical protein
VILSPEKRKYTKTTIHLRWVENDPIKDVKRVENGESTSTCINGW